MNFKEEIVKSSKKWDVVEELFDELGIENHGAFHDSAIRTVFVKVDSFKNYDNDKLEKAMGLNPSFATLGCVGVLTDKGPFDKRCGGWIYINYKKVLERL